MLWFTKSRRAQSDTDYETWLEGGVVPTLNAFDSGDVRATTVIVVRMREGKPGGGKGPLMSEDRSLTLATANDQTLFVFYGNRVDDVRIQDGKINTLQARMGTGGNNMPMVATTQVRRLTPLECERLQGFPDGWTEGQSDTHRYKQMGNAVAVPVVEWIISGIVDTIKDS
jgi:site-specific DNA-cytosine methylase